MTAIHFNGSDYVPAIDDVRLTNQIKRVFDALTKDSWLTLDEIHDLTGDPQASISAQIRHLRKKRFGSHVIDKRRRGLPKLGLWEYHLQVRP